MQMTTKIAAADFVVSWGEFGFRAFCCCPTTTLLLYGSSSLLPYDGDWYDTEYHTWRLFAFFNTLVTTTIRQRSRRPYQRHQQWHYRRRDRRCCRILITIRYSFAVLCQWRLIAIPYDGNQYDNIGTPVIVQRRLIRYCTVHRVMKADTVLYF